MRKAIPLSALIGLLSALPNPAHSAVSKGPYLQGVKSNSVTVALDMDDASATVEFGATTAYGSSASGTKPSQGVTQVPLTGLAPSSVYHYRVTTSGGFTSPDYTFITAPLAGQAFSFVAYGDNRNEDFLFDEVCLPGTGGHNCHHEKVVNAILAKKPDFLINTGDLVDDGDKNSQWNNFFNIEKSLLATIPMFPSQGNHDDNLIHQFFPITASNGTASLHYAFDYGNAHFLVVDTEAPYTPGTLQYQFITNDLAGHADKGPLFVFFHKPAISWGGHGTTDTVRQYLAPLFQQYGVDIVFQGHDHIYGRSDLISGVTYLVTGGGGANISPILSTNQLVKGAPVLNYVYVQIVGDVITAEALQPDAGTLDKFTVNAKDNDGKYSNSSPLPADNNTGDAILDSAGGGGCASLPGSASAGFGGLALGLLLGISYLSRRRFI